MNIDKILDESKIAKGGLLLILAVMGNYSGELLSCQFRKMLTENIFIKHFATFFILYFAVDFTSDKPQHPFNILYYSFLIYIAFLLFNKLDIIFTIVVFILWSVIYFLLTYKNYLNYENKSGKNNKEINIINNTSNIIKFITVIILLIGFVIYFNKQYKDHRKNWSSIKFMFGNVNCDSLK